MTTSDKQAKRNSKADLTSNIFDTTVNTKEDLTKLFELVILEGKRTSEWYFAKRKYNKFMGRSLRFLAIIASALGAIIPALSSFDSIHVSPQLATVKFAIAGLCIAFDKFGGFTSSWVRYLVTGQQIKKAIDNFSFEWSILENDNVDDSSETLDKETIRAFLNKAKEFINTINDMVEKETNLWREEFSEIIKDLESKSQESKQ